MKDRRSLNLIWVDWCNFMKIIRFQWRDIKKRIQLVSKLWGLESVHPWTRTSARQACDGEPRFAFMGEIPKEEDQGGNAGCREARTVWIITRLSFNRAYWGKKEEEIEGIYWNNTIISQCENGRHQTFLMPKREHMHLFKCFKSIFYAIIAQPNTQLFT